MNIERNKLKLPKYILQLRLYFQPTFSIHPFVGSFVGVKSSPFWPVGKLCFTLYNMEIVNLTVLVYFKSLDTKNIRDFETSTKVMHIFI